MLEDTPGFADARIEVLAFSVAIIPAKRRCGHSDSVLVEAEVVHKDKH